MALVLKDRVKETTTTTGTGSFALAGAVTGYDSFGQIGNGNTTYYAVYLDGGSEWEVGIGTYTAPSTLARTTILASSNAGNIVTFSAGQKTIWCDYPAGKAVYTDATGSISQPIVNISGITGSISSPDYIQFDTTYTTTLGVGQLGWDGNDTLGLGMSGGNIVQEIGLQAYIYGKASSAITKGQLIKKTGSNGSSGVITFAPTTANMTDSGAIIGIAAENIALNGFGYIISTGNLRGFNTTGSSSGETWADGDTLYYNPTGNGLMTKTKPSAPNMKTEVAIVINAGSGGSGSVAVEIIHGTQLGGTDSNVQITSATGGQLLSYDQTNSYWKNTNLAAGTGISVSSATGGTITVTNSAPDQTVAIASGTGISVTGTYPNFTVSNTGVTSVTGTSPVVSSGGATPAISMPAANATTNGYLTSTDWTTFNNKGSGTVTSVSALTLGTTGTDLSSTVANSTTTPVITLNVPTASATNRGALSSADWTTFNSKLTNPMTTLGDIIYGASSGTATRLAGNTTTNKYFLSQTGTGSASAVPSWSTLPTVLPVLNRSGATVSVAVGNGVLPVLTRAGSTVNVAIN